MRFKFPLNLCIHHIGAGPSEERAVKHSGPTQSLGVGQAPKQPKKEKLRRKEELIRSTNLVAELVDRKESVGAEDLPAVEEEEEARNAEHTQLAGQFTAGRGIDAKETYPGKVGAKELLNFGIEIATDAAVLAVKIEQKGRFFPAQAFKFSCRHRWISTAKIRIREEFPGIESRPGAFSAPPADIF
jgi:hypothetical protein